MMIYGRHYVMIQVFFSFLNDFSYDEFGLFYKQFDSIREGIIKTSIAIP